MKVVEYESLFLSRFAEHRQWICETDPRSESEKKLASEAFACIAVCEGLIREALELVKLRRAESNSAILACFKEQNNKWKKIAAKFNLADDILKLYLTHSSPTFANMISQI
ncbi:hypothetical protein M0R72_17670 [Candidatus Pacearchaeota archaeon]|jgi:hypothetical protein|nr:hypothetical protein [Candidatus Pacearchaeota archaeon]